MMGTLVATTVSVAPFDPRYATQFVPGYHRALHVGGAESGRRGGRRGAGGAGGHGSGTGPENQNEKDTGPHGPAV